MIQLSKWVQTAQTFLWQCSCKVKAKKISTFIIDDVDISPDNDNNDDDSEKDYGEDTE